MRVFMLETIISTCFDLTGPVWLKLEYLGASALHGAQHGPRRVRFFLQVPSRSPQTLRNLHRPGAIRSTPLHLNLFSSALGHFVVSEPGVSIHTHTHIYIYTHIKRDERTVYGKTAVRNKPWVYKLTSWFVTTQS